MGSAQTALRDREWSPPLAPYITLIENRVKERQLAIISKAFTALPLARVASMLACSIEDAEKGRQVRGVPGVPGRMFPTAAVRTDDISLICLESAHNRTRQREHHILHVTFYFGPNAGSRTVENFP